MSTAKYTILIIDDQENAIESAKSEIENGFSDNSFEFNILTSKDFDKGYEIISQGKADLVVLDVRRDRTDTVEEDETLGLNIFNEVKNNLFIPVIFWTALPSSVENQEFKPFITILKKDDLENLPKCIDEIISSGVIDTLKDIKNSVSDILRQYMWEQLVPYWDEYANSGSGDVIAQILLSRVTRTLESKMSGNISSHPSRRYVYPPVSEGRTSGDIVKDKENGDLWVILTPACDFANSKFDYILVAKAGLLRDHPKYIKWNNNKSKRSWGELRQNVLSATQGRYFFLPAFRDLPDSVIDFENIKSITQKELNEMEAVASLSSPFVEALLVQHSHFRGRVGTPDLNIDDLQKRLENPL
ncbi:hypothetical protein [Rothia sp. L_38]|uniref:hypothetical protein n=1 Tax=Rothia sp. L_38 TaxID=3422315 RepID=UPI003D6C32E2